MSALPGPVMIYDLMLLADPGTPREDVLRVLREAPDVRPDPNVENRFALATGHGTETINIGTKDPVESVHIEFPAGDLARMEAATSRALELAEQLEMRVEDVQWGHEVTRGGLPELVQFWKTRASADALSSQPPARRPWWRIW